jgi:DNA-binding response OmpR family regulator
MTKILVIDDEEMLREEVVIWLVREGFEVAEAADGMAGVESALRNLPDLIICDVTMPRLDGYGVLLEVHANPATANIPFIFVTARAAHDDIRKGMALGADDYITKPFTRQELLQTVEARLQKSAAQEQKHQQEVEELQSALHLEREQRLLKAKMVAMFSHDFRNPLSTIALMSHVANSFKCLTTCWWSRKWRLVSLT